MKFDIVVTGIGGQGVLTLAGAIAQAALVAGMNVEGAELHGLSMRFGPLECHVRLSSGKRIASPTVPAGRADLILGLERLETLRALEFAGQKTVVLFDDRAAVPILFQLKGIKYPGTKAALAVIRRVAHCVICTTATAAVKAAGFDPIAANIWLLGFAAARALMPLTKEQLLKGIAATVPPATLEANKKIFELGFTAGAARA